MPIHDEAGCSELVAGALALRVRPGVPRAAKHNAHLDVGAALVPRRERRGRPITRAGHDDGLVCIGVVGASGSLDHVELGVENPDRGDVRALGTAETDLRTAL